MDNILDDKLYANYLIAVAAFKVDVDKKALIEIKIDHIRHILNDE